MLRILRKKRHGFTLIELIMVIVVISVLAAIVVPRFVSQKGQAEIASTKANLATLRNAVELYYASEGETYPADLDALTAAGPVTGDIYMRKIPVPSVHNTDGDTAAAFTYNSGTGEVSITLTGTDANGDTIADY